MARSARDDLERFIDRYSPDIASLARGALTKLMERIPGAQVLVYDNYNALAIGFGPSAKASEVIVSMALYPRWIRLFFMQGASLPDPESILEGKGSRVRHIVLDGADTLDEPGVGALLDIALSTAKVPIDPAQPGKLIIQFVVDNPQPRRPGKPAAKAASKPPVKKASASSAKAKSKPPAQGPMASTAKAKMKLANGKDSKNSKKTKNAKNTKDR